VNVRQIHEVAPSWLIFRDGCPDGEAPEQVGARVDRMIARSRAVDGDIALFARGHVLLPRWIGLREGDGQHFLLDTVPCVSAVIGSVEHAMHESNEVFAPAAVRPGERFGRLPA
jgi:probable phosphoglycerate mutase